MFIVLLTFSDNKGRAAELMQAHNEWIQRGFDEGVFLLVGGLQSGRGGSVVAHNTDRPALEARVARDPFVAEGVVNAEILQINPARADDRLAFLLEEAA